MTNEDGNVNKCHKKPLPEGEVKSWMRNQTQFYMPEGNQDERLSARMVISLIRSRVTRFCIRIYFDARDSANHFKNRWIPRNLAIHVNSG